MNPETGELSVTVADDAEPGIYDLKVSCIQGEGQTKETIVKVEVLEDIPDEVAPLTYPNFTVGAGQGFGQGPNDPTPENCSKYSVHNVPDGWTLDIDEDTGKITGDIPENAEAGDYSITVSCYRGPNDAPETTFTITVFEQDAPVDTYLDYPDLTIGAGQGVGLPPNATPANCHNFRVHNVPAGWTLGVSSDGYLAGTIARDAVGDYPITISCFDADMNPVATDAFTITVPESDVVEDAALAYPDLTIGADQSFSQSLHPKNRPASCTSFETENVPAGWVVNAASDGRLIGRVGEDAEAGDYDIIVKCFDIDDNEVDSTSFTITVPNDEDKIDDENGSAIIDGSSVPVWLLPLFAALGLGGRITAGSSALGSSVEDGNGDGNGTDDEGSDLGSAAAGSALLGSSAADAGSALAGSALAGSALAGSALLGSSAAGSAAAPDADGSANGSADDAGNGGADTTAEANDRGEVASDGAAQGPATGPVGGHDVKAVAQAQAANAQTAPAAQQAQTQQAAPAAQQAQAQKQLANTGVQGTLMALAAGLAAIAAGVLLVMRRRNN